MSVTSQEIVLQEVIGQTEFKDLTRTVALIKAVLAELVGCFFLNFFCCCSIVLMININSEVNVKNIEIVAFCTGLTVYAVVHTLGHVSGAHINPAVTCAMMCILETSLIRGALYIVAQCIGSIIGSAAVLGVTPTMWQNTSGINLGVTNYGNLMHSAQAFWVEFILAFFLLMVICGVVDPNRPETKAGGALAIGLTVTLCHLAGILHTGASINPARSLGSAVVSQIWEHHWVYWVGPIFGGISGALVYVLLFKAKLQDDGGSKNKFIE